MTLQLLLAFRQTMDIFCASRPHQSSLIEMAQKGYGSHAPEFLKLYTPSEDLFADQALRDSMRDRDRVAIMLWASRHTKDHKEPVFLYFWAHPIPWPQHPEFGAFHTGEIPYLFDNLSRLDRPWIDIDRMLAHDASTYVLNFARRGDPNGEGLPRWLAFGSSAKEALPFGADVSQTRPLSPEKEQFSLRYFASPEGLAAPWSNKALRIEPRNNAVKRIKPKQPTEIVNDRSVEQRTGCQSCRDRSQVGAGRALDFAKLLGRPTVVLECDCGHLGPGYCDAEAVKIAGEYIRCATMTLMRPFRRSTA